MWRARVLGEQPPLSSAWQNAMGLQALTELLSSEPVCSADACSSTLELVEGGLGLTVQALHLLKKCRWPVLGRRRTGALEH